MMTITHVHNSLRSAARELRCGLASPVAQLSRQQFVKTWSSVFHLFPGLHPDGFEDADNGWPRVLKRFAAEAWRRVEAGEITEEELYPCDASWCGLYDRMRKRQPEEIYRRLSLAAEFGETI